MLKISPSRTFQELVDEIYKQLESTPWCSLVLFEFYIRRINILNGKIKNLTSDFGLKEDTYI